MKPDSKNPGPAAFEGVNSERAQGAKTGGTELSPSSKAIDNQAQQGQKPLGPTPNAAEAKPASSQSGPSPKGGFEESIAAMPAEDTDSIEDTWVDKASEIEAATVGDPYSKDDAQHTLSRAYLKNRFGLDVK